MTNFQMSQNRMIEIIKLNYLNFYLNNEYFMSIQ
jgi:hypothetical protein